MAQETGIAWCDSTFNAWTRCTRISPACDHCYAEQWANRAKHPIAPSGLPLPVWGPDAPRAATSRTNWNQPIKWNREAIANGTRPRVFCGSLMDVFESHPALDASGVRSRLWDLIEATPALDWLLLSKRWGTEDIEGMVPKAWAKGWPLNVWAGSTVENQEWAERRIPALLRVPAAVRFLSIEPMVGAVDLSRWIGSRSGVCTICRFADGDHDLALHGAIGGIGWVILGGESGHHARPFDLTLARQTSAQCIEAGIAVFWKQLGARPLIGSRDASDAEKAEHRSGHPRSRGTLARTETYFSLKDGHGGDVSEWPADLQAPELRRWPESPALRAAA